MIVRALSGVVCNLCAYIYSTWGLRQEYVLASSFQSFKNSDMGSAAPSRSVNLVRKGLRTSLLLYTGRLRTRKASLVICVVEPGVEARVSGKILDLNLLDKDKNPGIPFWRGLYEVDNAISFS